MKTFKTTQLTYFIIIVLFTFSCSTENKPNEDQKEKEAEAYVSPRSENDCQSLEKGINKRDHELLVILDPCYSKKWNKKIKKAFKKIGDYIEAYEQKKCKCDSTIVLFKSEKPIPLQRVASANKDLTAEGTSFGKALYNFDLIIQSPPFLKEVKTYQAEGKSIKNQMLVAVVDGGIRWDDYPQLRPYKWKNTVCGGNPSRIDLTETGENVENNHASLVSDILVKNLNSEEIKVMDVRIFDNEGTGTLFEAACGISFAINNGADIINASWGYYYPEENPTITSLTWEAKMQDKIIVTSAGNDGLNTDIKANFHWLSGLDHNSYNQKASNVLGVAYLNYNRDSLHNCSNYGKQSISLAAPGVFIIGSDTIEGSSYAAPQVARAIAIIKGNNYALSEKELVDCLLEKNTTKMPSLKNKLITEARLNYSINAECED